MVASMDRLGNPSSVHAEGRTARGIVDQARRQIATLADVSPSSVYFTSGATEANNWAFMQVGNGVAAYADSHDSVLRDVERHGGLCLDVDCNGIARMEAAADAIDRGAVSLISIAAVNNETGVVQPLQGLIELCRGNALVHLDAVQAPGKLDLSRLMDAVNFVSISGHKLGGPPGIGALIMADGSDPMPMIVGGGQENRRRAGTENLIGIAGFGAAAAAVAVGWRDEAERMACLRDRLEGGLLDICSEATIYGGTVDRVPNTTCIRMPGVPAETQVMALDLAGVSVSAGSACSSGKVTPSHVLRAMNVAEANAAEAIRISLGWDTTEADIDACIRAWGQLWRRKLGA